MQSSDQNSWLGFLIFQSCLKCISWGIQPSLKDFFGKRVSQDLQKPGRVIHHLGLPGTGGLLGTRTSIAKSRTVDHPSLLLGSARTPRILLHSSTFHSCQAVLLTDTEASKCVFWRWAFYFDSPFSYSCCNPSTHFLRMAPLFTELGCLNKMGLFSLVGASQPEGM